MGTGATDVRNVVDREVARPPGCVPRLGVAVYEAEVSEARGASPPRRGQARRCRRGRRGAAAAEDVVLPWSNPRAVDRAVVECAVRSYTRCQDARSESREERVTHSPPRQSPDRATHGSTGSGGPEGPTGMGLALGQSNAAPRPFGALRARGGRVGDVACSTGPEARPPRLTPAQDERGRGLTVPDLALPEPLDRGGRDLRTAASGGRPATRGLTRRAPASPRHDDLPTAARVPDPDLHAEAFPECPHIAA